MFILRKGDSGPYVQMLQLALYRAGFGSDVFDGLFGPATEKGLTDFQRAYGLVPDGVMGEKSFSVLKGYISGYTTVTAKDGDTLPIYAERYGSDEKLIRTANPTLRGERIKAGTRVTVPYNFTLSTDRIAYTALLTTLITEGLSVRYPFMNRFVYGKSVLGRELVGLSAGRGQKQLMYNASHHANEWITTPLLLRFTEEYARAVSSGTSIGGYEARSLFSETSLTVLPLVDPDGVDLVTGAIPDSSPIYDRCASLNYTGLPFPSGWKANIAGTDLNLNYPAGWEEAKKIKYSQGYSSPAPRDFVGEYPLSAPESKAVYDLTRKNNYQLTLSYHTQGKTIYWKYLDFNPPYSEQLAKFFSEASGYKYEETPAASGYAGYKDWFISAFNRPGYTIEAGEGENPLPLSQFAEIYRDNVGILAGAAAAVAKGK